MMDSNPNPPNWERSLLETVALQAITEQRRARRWGILFKLLSFAFLFLVLFAVIGLAGGKHDLGTVGRHTALVDLKGVIAVDSRASADKIIGALQQAFKDRNTQGVVLRIDSPGGSPVQAGYINDEIRRLRGKYPDIPLYAVVQDVCASGGYYVAVAADKIFVNKASLIGSIGVLMDGFGFTGSMEKLGIERRLITAGANKGFLDPFSPLNSEQKEFAEKLVAEIHQQFIKTVKEGRGKRLKETPDLFSGLVWSGEKSVELGLADQLGGLDYVAREIIKADEIVDYTAEENLAEQLAKRLGSAGAESLFNWLAQTRSSIR